jgi:hypothetical protein
MLGNMAREGIYLELYIFVVVVLEIPKYGGGGWPMP